MSPTGPADSGTFCRKSSTKLVPVLRELINCNAQPEQNCLEISLCSFLSLLCYRSRNFKTRLPDFVRPKFRNSQSKLCSNRFCLDIVVLNFVSQKQVVHFASLSFTMFLLLQHSLISFGQPTQNSLRLH